MSLSILNNIPAMQAQNQLNQTNSALQTTLYRLASGSKLNSGADDAAGLSIANGLTANVAALTQSAANASNGVGQLQTADGALSQVTSLLNRAVTLATEASTSTVDSTQAQSLQTEYSSIEAEIDRIGQKTNFNDQNVFGSSDTGASGTWASTDGSTMSDALTSGAKAFEGLNPQTLTITDTSTGNSVAFTTAAATSGATTAGDLNDLASEINTAASTAATKMNVTASVVKDSGDADFHLQLTDTSGSNAVVASTGATLAGGALLSSDIGNVSVGQDTVTNPNVWTSSLGAGYAGASTGLTLTTTLNHAGTMTITDSGTGQSDAVAFATTDTVGDLINNINAATAAGSLNVTASLTSAGTLQITDNSGGGQIKVVEAGDAHDFSTAGVTDTSTSSGVGSSNSVYIGDGTATTSANTITTDIAALSSAGLGLTQNLNSTTSAQAALAQITSAIASVAQQRGVIGASINRLNAATNVINTQIENLTSAQSNISSADISTEVSNMTKYNVLTQTGISALSQSNQMQQALLKLLQ
jgi:flagellin